MKKLKHVTSLDALKIKGYKNVTDKTRKKTENMNI